MAGDFSAEQDPDDNADSDFVESDPSHRYGRYKEVLGKGAFKTVYKAFDELEGIEVAWNQIKLADVLRNADDMERLTSEVHLLKTLKHKNIIKFYSSWVDIEHDHVNFITEIFTSGNLRQYRKKHKHVDLRALKNWSRQILQGLFYLHSHNPPVIHRDLKCDNIFVNGNQGEVKIGDLGLAAILQKANSAHSVIGTPEFMAPELYEEEYNELVDIYAFGMCLLELVTFEYPYVECANAAQIYKKVTAGIKPASLEKVQNPEVRQFIEKCIADVSERLPANELLEDPFLRIKVYNGSVGCSSHTNSINSAVNSDGRSRFDGPGPDPSRVAMPETSHGFVVEGQRKDVNTIFLKLRIADSTGHVHNIHFPFDIEVDTALSVAGEMVAELDLTDQDVTTIAEMIDSEIQAHIPEWVSRKALEEINGALGGTSDICDSETKDELSPLASDCDPTSGGLVLERLPSGRKYWSDSPKDIRGSPSRPSHSDYSSQFSEQFGESPGCEINGEKDGGMFSYSRSSEVQDGHENQPDCDPTKDIRESPSRPSHSDFSSQFSEQFGESPGSEINGEKEGGVFSDLRSNEVHDGHEDQPMDSHSNENQDLQLPVNQAAPKGSDFNREKDGGVILNSTVSELQNGQSEQFVKSQVLENQYDLEGSHPDDGSLSFGENDVARDNHEVNVGVLTNRLDCLLEEQQKELDELRCKHQLAIAVLLKDLSPETRDRVLSNCHFKVPMYTMQGKSTNLDPPKGQVETSASTIRKSIVDFKLDNLERPPTESKFTHPKGIPYSPGRSSIFDFIGKFKRQNSLCENRNIFNFMGKFKRQYSFCETGVTRPMFRDGSKPTLLKGDPKSASCLGIAVILADDT